MKIRTIPRFRPAVGPARWAAGRHALALAAVAGVLLAAPAVSAAQGQWVGTWATGPVAVEPLLGAEGMWGSSRRSR